MCKGSGFNGKGWEWEDVTSDVITLKVSKILKKNEEMYHTMVWRHWVMGHVTFGS